MCNTPYTVSPQHDVIFPATAKFVPANITLLPQLLKTVGYSTHIVGKFVNNSRPYILVLLFWLASTDFSLVYASQQTRITFLPHLCKGTTTFSRHDTATA